MLKLCLFIFVLFDVCVIVNFALHAEVETTGFKNVERSRRSNSNTAREIKKLEEIEHKLDQLRTLLRDPIDEEHENLEKESDETHAHEWTVQLDSDDYNDALDFAKRYGFDHVSKMDVGYGVYRFTHVKKDAKKTTSDSSEHTVVDEEEQKVVSKRDHIEAIRLLAADGKVRWYNRERILQREKRVPIDKDYYKEKAKRYSEEDDAIAWNDPSYKYQWYIKNTGQTAGPAAFDSNIEPVWKRGITGKGVVLSVLDDGMDHTHPELKDNYDPKASTDLNGHKPDPFPNDSDPYNAHGTKCSGTIAAKANDSLCGVGIAYNSNIGAIRMLDGKATDGLEANALSFRKDHIDIYSCSWGPKDNGQTFGRPGKLGRIALQQGAMYGRKGKGSLFIWATGNGGVQHDDCNADGYVNSIYTLGIGSTNEHGVSTYYGERCSAMFAVTYCSGRHSSGFSKKDPRANVITTYLHHQCTDHFVGTSSAAPLAAGIFALVLEANPNITWRDLQHLVFNTTMKTSPNDLGWFKNGAGKEYNHKFGFGVLNADKLVEAALKWAHVPTQRSCHFRLQFHNGNIPSRQHFKLSFKTDACQSCKKKEKDGKCKNAIFKLEHVVVNVTLKHRRRGDLSIQLISPSGTVSNLLHQRPYDGSSSGLKGWTFMTVYNWGENPSGTWKLIFTDNNNTNSFTKVTRDLEAEYMEKLDREKERARDGNTADIASDSTTQKYLQASKEKVVHADGDLYKKESYYNSYNGELYPSKRDSEYDSRSYRREESAYDLLRKAYEHRRQYSDYNSRSKRSTAFTDDKRDEVLYRKDNMASFKFTYEDEVLKRSDLAGEVTGIAVTFYGTA